MGYSFLDNWVTHHVAEGVSDAARFFEKPSKQDLPEVDVPSLVVDLLEAYVEAAEDLADPEPACVPTDTAIAADLTDFVVSGVDKGFEVRRVRPVRGPVEF